MSYSLPFTSLEFVLIPPFFPSVPLLLNWSNDLQCVSYHTSVCWVHIGTSSFFIVLVFYTLIIIIMISSHYTSLRIQRFDLHVLGFTLLNYCILCTSSTSILLTCDEFVVCCVLLLWHITQFFDIPNLWIIIIIIHFKNASIRNH